MPKEKKSTKRKLRKDIDEDINCLEVSTDLLIGDLASDELPNLIFEEWTAEKDTNIFD